jgi:hypothetical protein
MPLNPRFNLSGMVQVYSIISLTVWWIMLTATLFWKIWFPFNAKMREAKHQIKYIHIGCGLAGLLIPFIPVIAHMTSFAEQAKSDPSIDFVSGGLGFTLVKFPPIPCIGNNKSITFYTIILPSTIVLGIGITLILLVFWLVHRVSIYTSAMLIIYNLLIFRTATYHLQSKPSRNPLQFWCC